MDKFIYIGFLTPKNPNMTQLKTSNRSCSTMVLTRLVPQFPGTCNAAAVIFTEAQPSSIIGNIIPLVIKQDPIDLQIKGTLIASKGRG